MVPRLSTDRIRRFLTPVIEQRELFHLDLAVDEIEDDKEEFWWHKKSYYYSKNNKQKLDLKLQKSKLQDQKSTFQDQKSTFQDQSKFSGLHNFFDVNLKINFFGKKNYTTNYFKPIFDNNTYTKSYSCKKIYDRIWNIFIYTRVHIARACAWACVYERKRKIWEERRKWV